MFLEESLPTELAFGSAGGPMFATSIADATSGVELRTGRWAQDRGAWDAGMRHRTAAQTEAMISFFLCVAQGRANAWRFKDFGEGEDRGLNEYLGTGNGVQTVFQLQKHYLLGNESYAKTITKLVAGAARATLDGVSATAFTVNTATGEYTFTSAPANGVIVRASFLCEKPARLDTDWLAVRSMEPGVYSIENLPIIEVKDFV